MTKKLVLAVLILFVVLITLFIIYKKEMQTVCINDNCFEVEVVKGLTEKRRGLSFRKSLDQNTGMLFIYKREGFYSFWMKDMNFPLDIIWINKDKEIVYIEKNVQPCQDECLRYRPAEKAQYILEINSGLVDRLKIQKGDKLALD